ncbi:MAG: 50S ribosomal protein L4 [Dehalococcoidia bacterium]|nr:50S ribosomal protein L4 [Dehalococcoidia bacterium]
MKLTVRDDGGKELEQIEVADEVFGVAPNQVVIHQVYVAQMNARRSGVANTKTRGQVRGSTAKLRRQKGLGRARVGSLRSPVLTGGGVVFGPTTRSYSQSIPKRVKRLAIRSVLSAKALDGSLVVISGIAADTPSASQLRRTLDSIGAERSALVVTGEPDRATFLSARNLEKTMVLPAGYLNVADMVNHRHLVMTPEAIRAAEALWGGDPAIRRRPVAAGVAEEGPGPVPVAAAASDDAPADSEAKPRRRSRRAAAEPEGESDA